MPDRIFDALGIGSGRKFYMRDFRNAYKFRPHVNPVRQKFQGYVNFIFNRELLPGLFANGDAGQTEFRTTISSLVRTAELPGVNFQTETFNSYNRKRIVNTGVEYEPVNITVYDTVGNEWLAVLMKYFAYHYMDPRNKQQAPNDRDIAGWFSSAGGVEFVNSAFGKSGESAFDSNRAGYNPNANAHFFERIDYVLYHGNKGVQYSIINPVLTSFKAAELDYTASDFRDFQLSFEYERFTVHNVVNFGLSEEDLDRFENVSSLQGPAFDGDPTVAEVSLATRELPVLGVTTNSPAERPRTGQPGSYSPENRGAGTVTVIDTEINDAGEIIATGPGVQQDAQTQSVPATYGEAAVIGTESGEPDSNPFVDVLLNTGASAVASAIAGGNIRSAAIGAAVGGATTVLGQAARNLITGSSPNQPPEDLPPPPGG